jgi:hypothetical protein
MTAFISAAAVRDYLEVNASGSKYSDALIGSNIRAASAFIERRTSRVFERQTNVTKVFTTYGRAAVTIPGLATASAITLQGSTLTADSTYWLHADAQQTGLYTSIQVHNFGTLDYRSNPEWFDRNLDSDYWRRGHLTSLPNDLSITGDWGLLPADYPEPLLHATKILAAWYTKRPDSILANIAITAEGTALDYSSIPPEVGDFIAAYKLDADQVVTVG